MTNSLLPSRLGAGAVKRRGPAVRRLGPGSGGTENVAQTLPRWSLHLHSPPGRSSTSRRPTRCRSIDQATPSSPVRADEYLSRPIAFPRGAGLSLRLEYIKSNHSSVGRISNPEYNSRHICEHMGIASIFVRDRHFVSIGIKDVGAIRSPNSIGRHDVSEPVGAPAGSG